MYCSLWFDQGHMQEENLKWTVIVNYWQSLTTPAIISSAALSYWHHKTVIIKLYHTFQVSLAIYVIPIPIVVMSPLAWQIRDHTL